MSSGRCPEERTLYFGPPKGIYELKAFTDFAKREIVGELKRIGSPSECNVEEHSSENVIYHFPHAGIGLHYHVIKKGRCTINLMGTRKRELDSITNFILDYDNK